VVNFGLQPDDKENYMDNMKILKRAWYILWNYRTLWIFGLILALTVGGTANFGTGSRGSSQNNQVNNIQGSYPIPWDSQTFQDPQKFLDTIEKTGSQLAETVISQHEVKGLIGFVVAFIVLMLLVGVGMTILRYVSESAVIQMVDGFEARGEKLKIKQGFQLGWSPIAWRLFLIDLLIGFVPGLIMILLLGLTGWGAYSFFISNPSNSTGIVTIAVLAGFVFLFLLISGFFFLVVGVLRHFIIRACTIEKLGVWAAVRRGFSITWKNWKQVGGFWLIMLGLGIIWWIVSIILVIMLIPLVMGTVVLGAFLGSIPGLVIGLISSIFLTGYWPIVVGVVFGFPLFILVAVLPLLIIQGFAQVFRYNSWTLVFRELQSKGADGEVKELVSP
jgi:hypothetical protein